MQSGPWGKKLSYQDQTFCSKHQGITLQDCTAEQTASGVAANVVLSSFFQVYQSFHKTDKYQVYLINHRVQCLPQMVCLSIYVSCFGSVAVSS